MSKEDLDAISNSDGLAKALAVCQVFWLIIQMISRAASGLAVCQLEVATGAFAITTFLTYSWLWQKPQGVSRPIYLDAVRRPTIDEAWELAQCGLEETSSLLYRARSWRQSREHLKARAFSNTIMLICATALGAVHCAAWNFEFPGRVVSSLRLYEASSIFGCYSGWIHVVWVYEAVHHGGDVSVLVLPSGGGVCNDMDDKFAGHFLRVM
jgi:hypothetical protein